MALQGRNKLAPFGLFRKKKEEPQPTQEKPTAQQPTPEQKPEPEEPITHEPVAEQKPVTEAPQTPIPTPPTEQPKTYLKAMPLRELADLDPVKDEVRNGNIIILRITPLASKSIDDVKKAVDDLYTFASSVHGDIARLGEERIVITPEKIRIWREKTPAQQTENMASPVPTAA
jgi:SepF-like predicted cell division protein (DUF552 family)